MGISDLVVCNSDRGNCLLHDIALLSFLNPDCNIIINYFCSDETDEKHIGDIRFRLAAI